MNPTDSTTALPGAVCQCSQPCLTCACKATEKAEKSQGYRDSIKAALGRFYDRERRQSSKPVVVMRPLRKPGQQRRGGQVRR